jgi:acetylornithine deacetylase/succinyl-diaminopimelate desuccinylase-like protein
MAAAASIAVTGSAQAVVPSDRAVQLATARRADLVALLTRLVAIRSLSGETAEEAQAVVTGFLEALPYRIEKSADRPSKFEQHAEFMPPNPPGDGPFINVIGWPENAAGRRYAMFSHIDSHSIDDGWTTDPLSIAADDSRLYGLGTADDKGGVAAMLIAASILADEGETLPVVMSLHGKGGGSRGSLPVFDRLSRTDHGIGGVLYVHPAETGRGLEDIKNAVQGILDLELTVRGWRGAPMEIGSPDSSAWEEGGDALGAFVSILDHLRSSVFRDVDVNVGVLEAGDRIGSVADVAVARIRLKFEGDHAWRALLDAAAREARQHAGSLSQDSLEFSVELETIGYRTNPGEADWESARSRVLRTSIEDVTGKAPKAYPNHYAGDIRYPIRLLGVPAYGIGSVGGNFYGPNEWVDVDDLVRLVAVLVQTLAGWNNLSVE